MTGRELIMYILENHLEDEPVFKNETFVGHMTEAQFAEALSVGLATVRAWVSLGYIDGAATIGLNTYIPLNCKLYTESTNTTKTQGSDDKCVTN